MRTDDRTHLNVFFGAANLLVLLLSLVNLTLNGITGTVILGNTERLSHRTVDAEMNFLVLQRSFLLFVVF